MKNFADERVTLEEVTADVAGVAAAVTSVEDGHVYTIALTVAADAPLGTFDGRLRIHTSSPKERELAVPIRGTIVPASTDSSKADPVP